MDHYIKEALKTSKTIIIPEIGALTKISETTGELMFMNYLKHDDGTLAKFISNKEGITEQEAKNLLAKHSREISAILNKGETYSIFKFGSFFKNEKGEFEFEQYKKSSKSNKKSTPNLTETKAEAEVKIEKEKSKPQKDIESEDSETVEAIFNNLEKTNSENEIQKSEINEETGNVEETQINTPENNNIDLDKRVDLDKDTHSNEQVKPNPISEKSGEIMPGSTPNLKTTAESSKEKDKEIEAIVEEQATEKTPKTATKKTMIFGLFALILSGTVGVLLYVFVFNNEVQNQSNNKALAKQNAGNDSLSNSSQNRDSISSTYSMETNENNYTDSTFLSSEETTENTSSSHENSSQFEIVLSKPYKIIAGTFQQKQFAKSFAKKLEKDGVSCEIINRNNQNFVVVGAFDNIKSANKGLQKLKSKVKKAWVLKMN